MICRYVARRKHSIPADWPGFVRTCEMMGIVYKHWDMPIPAYHFKIENKFCILLNNNLNKENAAEHGWAELLRIKFNIRGQD